MKYSQKIVMVVVCMALLQSGQSQGIFYANAINTESIFWASATALGVGTLCRFAYPYLKEQYLSHYYRKKIAAKGDGYANRKNEKGETPLYRAIRESNVPFFKELIRAGARVDIQNNNQITPMDVAILFATFVENPPAELILKQLLELGINPNSLNKFGQAPLHNAAKNGSTTVVKLLLDAGAIPTIPDKDGLSALHHAAKRGQVAATKQLLNTRHLITSTDMHGKTALHYATREGHTEVVRALLEARANVNCPDITGKTPLHTAAEWNGNSEITRMLLQAGASIDQQDHRKRTALDLAKTTHNKSVTELLEK